MNQMQSRATCALRKCSFRWQNRGLASSTYALPTTCNPWRNDSLFLTSLGGNSRKEHDKFKALKSSKPFQRDFSVGKPWNQSTDSHPSILVDGDEKGKGLSTRIYQEKAKKLLHQVKTHRVQPELVTQKIEELLLLALSEYEDNVPSDGPLALQLLNTSVRYAKEESSSERLLPRLFSLSCQLMLKSGHPSAVNEVHSQLWRLLDGHEEFLVPTDHLYNTHHVNDVCSYYIRHIVGSANKQKRKIDVRRSQQSHRLIHRLSELHRDPTVPLSSNAYIDDSLILLFCNQLKPREGYQVLQKRVEKLSSDPSLKRDEEVPLVSSFTTIINGYAKTSQPEKAQSIIKWMMSFHESKHCSSTEAIVPPPNLNCFNALLHAYAVVGSKNAGFKVEQTLEWMEKLYDGGKFDTKPNETTYNICINAWARSKHPEAPIRAENLLRRVVSLGESGDQIEPSEEAFSAVMNTWVNSSSDSGSIKKMSEATDKVAGILDLMERISVTSSRLSLSAVSYTVLIKSWGKIAHNLDGMEKRKCEEEIFNVLRRMSSNGVTPTTETYNSVLTALVEISPISAVFYFLELEQQYCNGNMKLDTRTFNCGLNAIAVLNRPDAVARVTNILKRMFEYHETDPLILPSNLTFNIILKVLSRSTSHVPGAAAKADDLLSEMDEMESVAPDFISYVTCIIAWGRSDENDKIHRVIKLLQRYVSSLRNHDEHSKSSIAVFNAVLSVCHHNSSKEHAEEALHATKFAMSELHKLKGVVADRKTYESFFQVMKAGSSIFREDQSTFTALIEDEFNQCANDGYVTEDIIQTLRSAAPQTVFERLVGQSVDSMTSSIPKAW
eukprot:CAMPEP_0116119008 /NCGR_PEP_ID=MMETSP0329-20121206/2411_1 /TAXON_ID=697910 /ORGANISM="Pseudo-nitzschia arenysensis, Strain B593" /LENGTH=835 /DNA_ID=CAMNT_0003612679 /DNA_START=62 /DNA_END=2566 /DNA_ORIENTATION=+